LLHNPSANTAIIVTSLPSLLVFLPSCGVGRTYSNDRRKEWASLIIFFSWHEVSGLVTVQCTGTYICSHKAGSLKRNTALEYSTRVVQEGGRRCKKSTLNDLVHLTPLRIPLMNPPIVPYSHGLIRNTDTKAFGRVPFRRSVDNF
jgi:hypothetical protein